MGGGKLFLGFLKLDGSIFRMNRLMGFKVANVRKQGVYLLHAFFLRLHLCPDENGLTIDGIQISVQILHGGQLLFPQIADGIHDLVEIVHMPLSWPLLVEPVRSSQRKSRYLPTAAPAGWVPSLPAKLPAVRPFSPSGLQSSLSDGAPSDE